MLKKSREEAARAAAAEPLAPVAPVVSPEARELSWEDVRPVDLLSLEVGYRLGTAQCDVALAHADHRCGELEAAKARGNNALAAFRMRAR